MLVIDRKCSELPVAHHFRAIQTVSGSNACSLQLARQAFSPAFAYLGLFQRLNTQSQWGHNG